MNRFLPVIAVIALITVPANLVQAQPCRQGAFVQPSSETRAYRNQRIGFSFQLPANYRAMGTSSNRVDVLDPSAFEWTQCIIRNREAAELKVAPVSVEVKPVANSNNQRTRNLEAIVRANYPWVNGSFRATRVGNQSGITVSYEEALGGERVTDVYVLSPNKRNLIRISGPAQGTVLNLALSTFAFK
ncbi:MAG TPA: hypothetical protein V6C95_19065 [Coleofasciculaceae cyanobacterium]